MNLFHYYGEESGVEMEKYIKVRPIYGELH